MMFGQRPFGKLALSLLVYATVAGIGVAHAAEDKSEKGVSVTESSTTKTTKTTSATKSEATSKPVPTPKPVATSKTTANAATATTKKDAKSGTKDGKAATKDGKAGTKDAKSAPRGAGGDGAAEASAKAENAFGIGLYKEFAEKGKNPNVFISPFSLHSVLHLTYDGAKGGTAVEMAKVLGLGTGSVAKGNDNYKKLLEEIQSAKPSDSFTFSTANSLWANKSTKLKAPYVSMAKEVFDAQVQNLDFATPGAADTINKWVGERTHGKIDKIVSGLSDKESLVAVNAAYFKAQWATVFDQKNTKPADFKTGAGETKKVPMMNLSATFFPYKENGQMQIVELPYKDGRTAMLIILPSAKVTLADFRKSLTEANWNSWMKGLESQKGDVSLPKFTMGYEASCKDALEKAGMKQAFGAKADLSGMLVGGEKASISDVVHKTFVKVDEEGTEAAAASAVTSRDFPPISKTPPFKMVVDRPFFFAVVNQKTHAMLFAGQVTDPAEK